MRTTGLAAVIPAVVCGLCAVSPGAPATRAHETSATIGNPMAGNNGFGVVTRRDARLGGTESGSAVAVGGDLALGSRYTVARRGTGGFVAAGDARPTALLVGGAVDFAGSAADAVLRVAGDRYVKVGDLGGGATRATGMNGTPVKTRLVAAGAGYGTTPRVELTTAQPPPSVGPARGLMDFGTLFAGHRQRADALARCRGTVAPRDAGDATVRVRLADDRTNVLRLTGARLAGIRVLAFENRPTAARPLVIVVDTTAEGGELSWRTPTMAGVGGEDAPYILWTFADATDIALTAGDTLTGSVYAPRAELTDGSPADIEGDVVVRALKAGPLAGGIRNAPFTAEPSCDDAPATTPTRSPSPAPSPPGAPGPEPKLEPGPEPEPEPKGEPDAEPEPEPEPAASGAVTDARPPSEPSPAPRGEPRAESAEMADTGSRPKLWLLGAGAVLLVTTGAVLTRASRRNHRDPGE
ncbi:collagen-binding domain-containing protein [Streptomyces sp. CB03238]|uniref:collagen-binding domain-containing protein n=1 Tax=Streptomyces sp. CB03238 TaxID=1907777 RepID=UPI000A0F9119|nr:collagen-binding domain-containing protein [Streptomyces sp. CB03238]ORT55947.1 hypothetical protein BKD26_30205 [Streptomyces sp. CB03238]